MSQTTLEWLSLITQIRVYNPLVPSSLYVLTVGTFPWLIPSGSKRSEFSERDLKIELRLSLGLERTQKRVPGKGEN